MTNIKQISLFERYKNLSETVRFVLNSVILILFWIIFYKIFRYTELVHIIYENTIAWFTNFLIEGNKLFLELLGYEVSSHGKTFKIIGTSGIFLDRGCLARNLMGLFAGFILAYPGSIKNKIWYIPMGLIIINILNIFRLSGLAILTDCCPDKVEFNHHYVFKIVVFSCFLVLWYIWIFKMNKQEDKI